MGKTWQMPSPGKLTRYQARDQSLVYVAAINFIGNSTSANVYQKSWLMLMIKLLRKYSSWQAVSMNHLNWINFISKMFSIANWFFLSF